MVNSDRVFERLVPLLRWTAYRRRQRRREAFLSAAVPDDAVVFLGDSITEVAPLAELFPELRTVNRGIGWDTTEDLLARLDEAVKQPAAVSLLIGTNDLHTSRGLADPEGIGSRIEEIIGRIRSLEPEVPVLLHGVLPRTSLYEPRLRALNARIRTIAERTGCTYVDAWPALAGPSGAIDERYTTDNLHLTPAGYIAWRDALLPLLLPLVK